MQPTDNYAIQAQSARQRFLTYDQEKVVGKFNFPWDEAYVYPVMLSETYRLCRRTGNLEKNVGGAWIDANSFDETMTLLDLLCDSKENRCLTGRWKTMQDFGLLFHRNLLEEQKDPLAEAFDLHPQAQERACLALNGRPIPGGDLGYGVELFDGLSIGILFWHGDEEFAPRLRYYWDENALSYIRYETMYYAVNLLKERLQTFL